MALGIVLPKSLHDPLKYYDWKFLVLIYIKNLKYSLIALMLL